MIEIGLGIIALYLLVGIFIAIPFVFAGAKKVDPGAVEGTWGFKLLIIPGAAALWPLILKRWMGKAHPTECSAHRRAARR